MSIEELKKQEDSKIILADLLNEIGTKIQEKTKTYVRASEQDFRQYFAEKGFTVRKDETFTAAASITAKYGNLSAELS